MDILHICLLVSVVVAIIFALLYKLGGDDVREEHEKLKARHEQLTASATKLSEVSRKSLEEAAKQQQQIRDKHSLGVKPNLKAVKPTNGEWGLQKPKPRREDTAPVRSDTSTVVYDSPLSSPLHPLNPMNPIYDTPSSSSCDTSYDSGSSSSSDSGSSSCGGGGGD